MKKIIKGKKIIKRSTIKRVVRARVPTYDDLITKSTKKQMLLDLYMHRNDPNSHRYKINIKYLRLKGMSIDDIAQALKEIDEDNNLRRNLIMFYNGKIPSNTIIEKWGHKGLTSSSDVESTASKLRPYEVDISEPKSRVVLDRDLQDNPIRWGNLPSGQRNFNSAISRRYRDKFDEILNKVALGKLSVEEAMKERKNFLLDLAEDRPEYAAVISNLLRGGKFEDAIASVRSKFEGAFGKTGTKDDFIRTMEMWKLNRSRTPEYQREREEWIKNHNIRKEKEMQEHEITKLPPTQSETEERKRKEKIEEEFKEIKEKAILESKQKDRRDDLNSVQQVPHSIYDTNMYKSDENVIDRKRRKVKIISRKKPILHKVVKKKIRKQCRCR